MAASYYSGVTFTDIIKGEIEKISGSKKKSEKSTMVLCPFHNEKTPSARIWHDNGNFQCFGCGKKTKWNVLAAHLNLQQVGNDAVKLESQSVPLTDLALYEGMVDTKKGKNELLRFYELDSYQAATYSGLTRGKWRGYTFEFLAKVGIKLVLVEDTRRYYMYLPITIKGKTKGYIKAQFVKPRNKDIPSYINSKGSWSRSSGLFPYDYAVQVMREGEHSTLVLVEGPRDALRLLRFGIPAVCIMGTHSWSKKKMQLLEFSGATRIVLMLDGDAAGKACTRLIKTGMNDSKEKVTDPLSSLFDVKIVKLWNAEVPSDFADKKYDPGNCPVDILQQVKKLIK